MLARADFLQILIVTVHIAFRGGNDFRVTVAFEGFNGLLSDNRPPEKVGIHVTCFSIIRWNGISTLATQVAGPQPPDSQGVFSKQAKIVFCLNIAVAISHASKVRRFDMGYTKRCPCYGYTSRAFEPGRFATRFCTALLCSITTARAKAARCRGHQHSQQHGALCCHHRSEEHTSELQSRPHLVCRLLLEKKKKIK